MTIRPHDRSDKFNVDGEVYYAASCLSRHVSQRSASPPNACLRAGSGCYPNAPRARAQVLDGEVMRIEVLQGKLRMLVAYHPRYS